MSEKEIEKKPELSEANSLPPEIEVLPKEIVDYILADDTTHEYRDNVFGVTELLGCLRKTYYKRTDAKEGKAPEYSFATRWYFTRGDIFDEALTSLFNLNQVRVTHRVPSTPIAIVGRIDFIKDDTVFDLKTAADGIQYILRNQDHPKEDHEKQVLFYAYCNGNPKAGVVYVTLKHIPFVKWARMELQEEVIKEIEQNAKVIYISLRENEAPPKKRTWRCKWRDGQCEYFERCWGEKK